MSQLTQTIGAMAPAVFVLAPLGALLFVVWRRSFGGEELALHDMLVRQGVSSERVWTAESARQLALAARRCASCGATKTCREWLDSGRREGYEQFCANASFIERLK